MPDNKSLTLSIVIPVYNEESHLKECLDAIACQTVAPDEVIIVDNNSTDDSVKIAEQYNFVKLIIEPKKGYIPARNRGFNAARGNILGRINGDSILAADWVETVKKAFNNRDLTGLGGIGRNNVIWGINIWYSTLWSSIFLMTYQAYFRTVIMWGGNMAITKDIWELIRNDSAKDYRQVHEDQDLSLLIAGNGGIVKLHRHLLVQASGRRYIYWPNFIEYFLRCIKTKNHHKQIGTYNKENFRRLSFWQTLPYILIGVFSVTIFAIYSFLMWPVAEVINLVTGNKIED